MSDAKSDPKTFFITGVSHRIRPSACRSRPGRRPQGCRHAAQGSRSRRVRSAETGLRLRQAARRHRHRRHRAGHRRGREAGSAPIDVLVNNAGYGHEGLVEESTIDELRRQFEVNVFGPVGVIQAVLPYMRKRRAGHILNITSMGGLITFRAFPSIMAASSRWRGFPKASGKRSRASASM